MSERRRISRADAVLTCTVQVGPYEYETEPRVMHLTSETTVGEILRWVDRERASAVDIGALRIALTFEEAT